MKNIAGEEEILEYLTYMMRREDEEIRLAESFKAAELLGKHYGMFGGRSEQDLGDVIIVDNIGDGGENREYDNDAEA